MNPLDLLTRPWLAVWEALTSGAIKAIPAKRWTLSIDDVAYGNAVTHHAVGVDAVGAWSKWEFEYEADDTGDAVLGELQSWVTPSKRHVIKLNGQDVEKDSVRVRLTTVGFPMPKVVIIINHRFVDSSGEPRLYRFDARL